MNQSLLDSAFDSYFHLFPFKDLIDGEGFDMGVAQVAGQNFVAPRVGFLNCIDPSEVALEQAKINLQNSKIVHLNVREWIVIL